jgi:hypothetical protein
MAHEDVAISISQLVGALASTRLPNVSNSEELGEVTLNDSRILTMLEGLSATYGWAQFSDMKDLKNRKAEDMLWLWCMHSMWTSPVCKHLLATTCRAGWSSLTNCRQFGRELRSYTNGQRPDLVCFLGPIARPAHAVFCELKFEKQRVPEQPEDHRDYDKVIDGSTLIPTSYVLIDGTLSMDAERTQKSLRTPRNEMLEYLVIAP